MDTAKALPLAAQRTFVPRDYQTAMIDSIAKKIDAGLAHRILGVAPTGSGKGLMVAMLCQWFLKSHRWARVLVLCHQGHLLTQNEATLNDLEPTITTGVYCAGEGRKDKRQQVIFASRDSLRNKPDICGFFDAIIIDEAHLINADSSTSYGKIFKVHSANAKFVVGFTGTPWRLGIGEIWGHDKAFFEDLAYEIKMRELIDQGYLSEYKFPEIDSLIDTSNVKISSTGDYNSKELTVESNKVVGACLEKWHKFAADRKLSIFFCCSRDHAKEVFNQLTNEYLSPESVCYVDGDITGTVRKTILADIKAEKYQAIVNVGVLTTGFDAPSIDCVVMLRATQSVSLLIQCLGRGLRTADDKKDCLVLDMAGNLDRFGSIEDPYIEGSIKKQERREENRSHSSGGLRACPKCENMSESQTTCDHCGHLFISHTDETYQGPSYETYTVDSFKVYTDQQTKNGVDCSIVYYYTEDGKRYKEWILTGAGQSWQRKRANLKLWKINNLKFDTINIIPGKNPKFPRVEPNFYDSAEMPF